MPNDRQKPPPTVIPIVAEGSGQISPPNIPDRLAQVEKYANELSESRIREMAEIARQRLHDPAITAGIALVDIHHR